MDKINWIKDLVLAEQQMEESGVIDVSGGFDPEKHLAEATLEFMRDLKAAFIESASAFNQLKGSSIGTLKLYGISKTEADFMLFRNGFKLIFSVNRPGIIKIKFNSIGNPIFANPNNGSQVADDGSDNLRARWKAFGELEWTYDDKKINLDYLVRYYMTRFVKESTK
ncbi:MAG: hypothetical protein HRT45_16195 [Bdellovibrionales bacterium]|nr:hypothetical protein [Bdellovibrionales bacterium]